MQTFTHLYDNADIIRFKKGTTEYTIKLQGTTETPYFCGKDVCEILGYVNDKKALQVHVKPKHKLSLNQLVDLEKTQHSVKLGKDISNITYHEGKTVYVSEPGLYSLIMHSRTAFAESFQDIVYEQILPSIRKCGSFHLVKELELKNKELEDIKEYNLTLRDLVIPETKRTHEEIIYISTSKNYAKQNRFKIGGVEGFNKLKGRLSQYNGRSAAGDEWYFTSYFKVASYRDCERRICDVMHRFRDKKLKEIYIMHYDNIQEFVKYIVDHYTDEISLFDESLNMLISNLNKHNMKPIVPDPCTEIMSSKLDKTIDIVKSEDVITKQLKDYLDALPSGTIVNRSDAIDKLEIKTNKRGFWRWLKDLIPSYPSLYFKY